MRNWAGSRQALEFSFPNGAVRPPYFELLDSPRAPVHSLFAPTCTRCALGCFPYVSQCCTSYRHLMPPFLLLPPSARLMLCPSLPACDVRSSRTIPSGAELAPAAIPIFARAAGGDGSWMDSPLSEAASVLLLSPAGTRQWRLRVLPRTGEGRCTAHLDAPLLQSCMSQAGLWAATTEEQRWRGRGSTRCRG